MDINAEQATRLLTASIYENIESAIRGEPYEKRSNWMLEGEPGNGKTTCMRQAGRNVAADADFIAYAAAELGFEDTRYFTRTYILAQQEAGDIAGLPWAEDGEMIKLRPQILPLTGLCTLSLDEVRKAKTSVINAIGQVLLEGRIGDHRISPGCTIMLASNERKDRAGDTELPSHFLDRVTLARLVTSRKKVIEYGMAEGWDAGVVFFMESQPDYFNKRDEGQLIHPTPRSYERISDRIKSGRYEGDDLRTACEGTMGPAAGHALYSFLSLRTKVPHPKVILANPENVPLPDNRQSQWAMISALSGYVEKKDMGNLKKFLDRFDKEVGGARELSVMLIQSLFSRDKKLFLTAAGNEICAGYSEVVFGEM